MGLGKMSYDDALGCAERLGKTAADLGTHLSSLKAEIMSMDEVLVSEGASQLLTKYDNLDKQLATCPAKIEGYEAYLKEAVQKYRASDAALKQEGK